MWCKMLKKHPLAGCSATLLLLLAPSPGLAKAEVSAKADLLFINGMIYTPQGWRSSMEIRDGLIVGLEVGDLPQSRLDHADHVIDLHGQAVLPGLYDMHIHTVLQAKGGEGRCRIPQDSGGPDLVAAVKDCVAKAKPGDWISGGQWQSSLLDGTPITSATLDAVSPDNPVMLFDVSGHSVWANSKAMELAGIGNDMPNPEGGIIERDATGKPTGVLRETAGRMVSMLVPPQSQANTEANEIENLDMLSSFGVVGFVEAMVYRDDLKVLAALADKGQLKQRVQACIAYSESGRPNPDFDALIADRKAFARANLNTNCIKVFADGVPTESHTGAMLEPYKGGQSNAPARGLLLFDPQLMASNLVKWDSQGMTVMFHAAGDRAVRSALDAIEAARKANGMGGPIHQVAHSTFVSKQDLPRFKQLHTAVEYSPYLWDPQPINDDITSAVGHPEIDRVWPIKEGFEAGALVVAGSDWAVIPVPDPWIGIETSITRRNPGGSARSFGLQEAITLPLAIRMFSIDAAERLGIADRAGSLEKGKSADFLVLNRNPFDVPVTAIHSIKPAETWLAGKKIYSAAAQ